MSEQEDDVICKISLTFNVDDLPTLNPTMRSEHWPSHDQCDADLAAANERIDLLAAFYPVATAAVYVLEHIDEGGAIDVIAAYDKALQAMLDYHAGVTSVEGQS